jgi:disulfide bond formation protein DsbB
MNDGVDTTLAALAILAQVATVLVVAAIVAAAISPRARAALVGSWDTLARQSVWLAWLVATTATLGSLYFSEVADYLPCRLCWFQRIAMYPLVVILLVGALLRDRRVSLYAAVFPVVGAAISIYHIYIEVNPDKESAACRAGVPCSVRWIDEFGYVTIPVMALSAFALISALLVVSFIAGRRADDGGDDPGSAPVG